VVAHWFGTWGDSFHPVSRRTLTANKVIPEVMKSEVRKFEKDKFANI
jgi:hypothetical protein